MGQTIELNWQKCRDGYEIGEFDTRKFDWKPDPLTHAVTCPEDATPFEKEALSNWGMHLCPPDDVEYDPVYRIIKPRSKRSERVNVMRKSPDLFTELANIETDTQLLSFINDYGPLTSQVAYAGWHFERAMEMRNALIQLEEIKILELKNPTRAISRKHALLEAALKPDLQLEYRVSEGNVHLVLKPADLLDAIWAQFLLSLERLSIARCASCQSLMSISTQIGRADKRFCSNACKQRHYRNRMKDH